MVSVDCYVCVLRFVVRRVRCLLCVMCCLFVVGCFFPPCVVCCSLLTIVCCLLFRVYCFCFPCDVPVVGGCLSCVRFLVVVCCPFRMMWYFGV